MEHETQEYFTQQRDQTRLQSFPSELLFSLAGNLESH